MARHRATRPSIASVISNATSNGTRSRTKLSYEQNALLALAENDLKNSKKPLNISAIVKNAERRAKEQGLELGVRARPSIKKAVEKLSEHGAIAEAPRKGRAPAEYRLTPKAVKVYNDAKAHRRSDIGIAKETLDTLKGNTERPSKRRRSSVSASVASPRSTHSSTVEKLKAQLSAARSEIASLKQTNNDLLDQQLDDDDDDDIFGSPTRKATTSKRTASGLPACPPLTTTHTFSFSGNRPTRPTTPEPTENGSPDYETPGEFGYSMDLAREMTPPSSSPPDAVAPQHIQQGLSTAEKSELELKVERLEASISELSLEKGRMAEEIIELKNQVEHERQNATRLTQVQQEADLVRVELIQVAKDRDSALKDASHLSQDNAALEGQCVDLTFTKEQLEVSLSQLKADLEARTAAELEAQTSLINTSQELEATRHSLTLSQDEARRITESYAMADATSALLNGNLAARDATIAELQQSQSLTTEQLHTLRSEVQTLRDNLASAQERVLGAETIANERESQIAGLKAEQEALRGTIEGLQTHKSALVSEKATLIAQIESMKAVAERDLAKIAGMSQQIEGLNAQVEQLQQELQSAQLEKDEIQAKAEEDSAAAGRFIAQRDVIIAERDIQFAKLQSTVQHQAQELLARQARIEKLDAALAESTKAIQSLEAIKKSTEMKLAASIKSVDGLNVTVANLQERDQANSKRIGELKADLLKHKDAVEEHQDVISKLELQVDRLRNIELESLRRRRAKIEAEAKRLRDEEADLTRETIDVDQWDESLTQSRAARSSLAPSWGIPSSP